MDTISPTRSNRVLIVVDDLFFSARIGETARQLGAAVTYVRDTDELDERLRLEVPALVIVDLGLMKTDPIAVIERLKAHPDTRSVPMIAYGSHVNHDLMAQAASAGCEQVLPRSAFSQRLPGLLRAAIGEGGNTA